MVIIAANIYIVSTWSCPTNGECLVDHYNARKRIKECKNNIEEEDLRAMRELYRRGDLSTCEVNNLKNSVMYLRSLEGYGDKYDKAYERFPSEVDYVKADMCKKSK